MAELPEWLRIPESFASSGDPHDANPFSIDDIRHTVWQEATQRAEEEWARVNADWMAALSPQTFNDWFQGFQVARFNVWAKRGIHVVWTEPDVRQYDAWLVNYANATLATVAEAFFRTPPPFGRDALLLDLRNRLGQQIQYWKAEARRYQAEVEAELAGLAQVVPIRVTANILKRRKRLIKEYRARHDLLAADFARRVGISDSAIRGIVREDTTRFAPDSQQRLLAALGLTKGEWDQEEK